MNPDGQIWDSPEYGVVDLLMEYDLEAPTMPQLIRFKDKPGSNGFGIRVSPDGDRVTYHSSTGYPQDSHCIPAWYPRTSGSFLSHSIAPARLPEQKCRTIRPYPLSSFQETGSQSFSIVKRVKRRRTGLHSPPTRLAMGHLDDAFFSPDGMRTRHSSNQPIRKILVV